MEIQRRVCDFTRYLFKLCWVLCGITRLRTVVKLGSRSFYGKELPRYSESQIWICQMLGICTVRASNPIHDPLHYVLSSPLYCPLCAVMESAKPQRGAEQRGNELHTVHSDE